MQGPGGRPAASQKRPFPARWLLPWAMILALLVGVSTILVGTTATDATQAPPGGLFIIRKVIINAPANTTSTFSGTLVKAQGNQLIGSFTTLAQGHAVYFPGLANGTYIVNETEPSLVGYWSSPGNVSCPAQPSSDPNQDRGQINIPTDIVTICVYNQVPAQVGGGSAPTPTPVPAAATPTPVGSTTGTPAAPTSTATPWPTPIAPSTGSGEGGGSSSSRLWLFVFVLVSLTLAMPLAGRRRRPRS